MIELNKNTINNKKVILIITEEVPKKTDKIELLTGEPISAHRSGEIFKISNQ